MQNLFATSGLDLRIDIPMMVIAFSNAISLDLVYGVIRITSRRVDLRAEFNTTYAFHHH